METYNYNPDKTVAALIHLSTFSQFFIPLGNFILPLILWTAKKKDHFVDEHGKQALNFQISMFLYFSLIVSIGVTGIIIIGLNMGLENAAFPHNISMISEFAQALPLLVFIIILGVILLGLFILQVIAVITATVRASEGDFYKYPLTINFIKPSIIEDHQSKNEQFNNTQNQRQ